MPPISSRCSARVRAEQRPMLCEIASLRGRCLDSTHVPPYPGAVYGQPMPPDGASATQQPQNRNTPSRKSRLQPPPKRRGRSWRSPPRPERTLPTCPARTRKHIQAIAGARSHAAERPTGRLGSHPAVARLPRSATSADSSSSLPVVVPGQAITSLPPATCDIIASTPCPRLPAKFGMDL